MAEIKVPAKRSAAVKAHQTMEIKAHIGHMTPDTIDKHMKHLLKTHKPQDLLTLGKYVDEVISRVKAALLAKGYVPEKGERWNGFKLGMSGRKVIVDQADTEEITVLKAAVVGAKAIASALERKLKIVQEYEVLKDNGEIKTNSYYTVSFLKPE